VPVLHRLAQFEILFAEMLIGLFHCLKLCLPVLGVLDSVAPSADSRILKR
jgi:hypothetical protein